MILTRKDLIIHSLKKQISARGFMTCIDIEKIFRLYNVPAGNLTWSHPLDTSMVCWTGFSEEGIEMLTALAKDENIRINKASTLTYLYQGAVMKKTTDPFCQRAEWYPVTFMTSAQQPMSAF